MISFLMGRIPSPDTTKYPRTNGVVFKTIYIFIINKVEDALNFHISESKLKFKPHFQVT
jgi:hypothetical protein